MTLLLPTTGSRRQPALDAADSGDLRPIDALLTALKEIHADLLRLEDDFAERLAKFAAHSESARNLIHYLGLRRHDIRPLQEQLAALGLSSLGRTESHVLAGLESVLALLGRLTGAGSVLARKDARPIDFTEGNNILRANTDALLGPSPSNRYVRIMVTMPSEAACDYLLVRRLVAKGMNCMRVNCAHDNREAWARMIENLRRAKDELGQDCRIEMDLTGPKLRTGSIDPSTQVVKWRPARNRQGEVATPAQIWLTPADDPEGPPCACGSLRIPDALLAQMHKGDTIRFQDLRGKFRTLEIAAAHGRSRFAHCTQTVYLNAETALPFNHRPNAEDSPSLRGEAVVAPPEKSFITLKPGDQLVLTRAAIPGRSAVRDERGKAVRSATIACTLPEVFSDLHPNEPIWFDDGKIGGVIDAVGRDEIRVRITIAKPEGDRLGADKGINLPNSFIRLPALTTKDIEDLAFVVKHADIVGLSFIRRPEDVAALQAELARLNASDIGVVLKIETQTAFEQLPGILLQALCGRHVGVMIARGDLAVECGWERLAEVQEEILWLCEAAHVPVIWATQVLENMAKKGVPSRAEITDAAMGERAECVMLNKGQHLVKAVHALDDILCRMEAHQSKKSARLRPLHLSVAALKKKEVA